MSRRDTIVVAVLINAGLLVVLFVSALRTGGSYEPTISEASPIKKEPQTYAIAPKLVEKKQLEKKAHAPVKEKKKKSSTVAKALAKTPKKKIVKASPQKTVTIQKGDMLEKIARSNSVTVNEIMKFNHLSNTKLQIGQIIKIPPASARPNKKVATSKIETKYYIVKSGDSPWTIARKNNIQVNELLKLNNMDEIKAKKIRPGDKLRIK